MESLNAQLAQFALQSMEQLKNGKVDLSTLGAMTVAEEVIDAEVE
jgi:hypothetical protein